MSRKSFCFLSLTWGLPITLIGGIVAVVLLLHGYRPKRGGWVCYFEVGENWGGLSLGIVFLCGANSSPRLKAHEFGHSIQNCRYGVGMVFLTLLSAIRYHYIEWLKRNGKTAPTYESWWFEKQATEIGEYYIESIMKGW